MRYTALFFKMLMVAASCLLCCCHQNNSDIDSSDSNYDISSLIINYNTGMHPHCLTEYINADDFFADSDLRKMIVNDSSTIELFRKVITDSKKDTIQKILCPPDPPVTIFDPDIGDSIVLQLLSVNEKVCYYWENGTSALYVVELQTESGTDTLIIPNGPSKVQYNNTVFNDSTLFYIVTKLICDNDEEWAKYIPNSFKEHNINEIVGREVFMRE